MTSLWVGGKFRRRLLRRVAEGGEKLRRVKRGGDTLFSKAQAKGKREGTNRSNFRPSNPENDAVSATDQRLGEREIEGWVVKKAA